MLTEAVSDSTPVLYPFEIVRPNNERKRTEVLLETFIRKQLRLKAHTVTKVEETDECVIVWIDRLGKRLLRCGVCRQRCREVHSVRKERDWRDLSLRKLPLKLRYRPRRVECPRCGVRVEDFPWAEAWARVTTALSNAVAILARELSWQGTARQYGLNWKSVATIVKRAVQYGLRNRVRPAMHVIGIDEVSRRKGQIYLTVVYDLERRVLVWGGEDRTEEAVRKFFTVESTFAGSIAPVARLSDVIVALSCRDCSSAIAAKSVTRRFVAEIVLRKSRIPPAATISCSNADVTAFTDRITESALLVSSAIPGVEGPIGTVSPSLKERGSGREGVRATA